MHFEQAILIALAVATVSAKRALPWQKEFLDLANTAREEAGLGRLCLNAKLNSAAHKYALTLQQTNQFSHEADGTKVGDRAREKGFQYEKVGENLASDDSAEGAFKRLMESEGHRKNILDPNFRMMGVGGTSLGEQHQGNWIQLFGKGANEKCLEEEEDGNDKNEEGGGENDSFEEEGGDENGEFDPKELMSQFDGGLEMCVAPDQQGRPVKYECPFKEVRQHQKQDNPQPAPNNRPEDQKKGQNNPPQPSQNNQQQQQQKQQDDKKKDQPQSQPQPQPQPAQNNQQQQQQNKPQYQGEQPRQAQQPRSEQYQQQTEKKKEEKSTEQKSKETGQSGNQQYQRENQKKSSEKQESEKKQETKQQSCPGSSKQSHQQSERKSTEKKEEQKTNYQSNNLRKRSRIAGRHQRY